MNLHQINFKETKRFSSIFLDYINNIKELQSFYDYRPTIESFKKAIGNRKFDDSKREILAKTLKKQYENSLADEAVAPNIESLKKGNSYTVTTGHQLNIFTGPLFFIYKITSVITMAKILNEKYPDQHFVPVYWMASEDHDFEEINNFQLFGKKYRWESSQKGPVGKFETESMAALLNEISDLPDFFKDAYDQKGTLAEATRFLVNHLFGKYGLVILDADDAALKKQFRSIIEDDILNHKSHKLAVNSSKRLEELGYKSQIFPRPINFFYMENGLRERIEEVDGKFNVLNTSHSFSKDQIAGLIEEHPEKFSPNVVLRPVFQETILPNLAYIGGPAEVAYWLQLKDVFDHFQLPFPIIFSRLFVLIISKTITKKMIKLGLDIKDVFSEFNLLKDQLLYSDGAPDHDLSEELIEIEEAFQSIKQKSGTIDRSLEGFIASEYKKVEKGIGNIQKRLKKAEEQKEEVKLNQLQSILDKLFPNGNPQEREDNFLNFYINNPKFIDELIDQLNPFSLKYNILSEDV